MQIFKTLLVSLVFISPAVYGYGDDKVDKTFQQLDGTPLTKTHIDSTVQQLMKKMRVTGLALALVQNGQVVFVQTYGQRNVERDQPLEITTVMYGASLTKMAFAYLVMQLIDDQILELDRPISEYLKKPLPDYPKYADLKTDIRWKKLTTRMLLSHTTGFPNYRFTNTDGKLDFKLEPGTRYGYSGEGINLMQFVLEEGLGLDVGQEMQRRVFDRFGMKQTSMIWRDDFAGNLTNGYDLSGKSQGHIARRNVRAAGSMDTTIKDFSQFYAGYLRGEGVSSGAYRELVRPQIKITSSHQFPTIESKSPESPYKNIGLSAGLGIVLYKSPYGLAFFKGGHDDFTANFTLGILPKKSGIVLLSNSVRAEAIYPELVKALLGETGMPWNWEYNLTDAAGDKK